MSRPLRIAVADDEPDMRDFLETCLTRLGHEVVAAVGTGRELIAACDQHAPELVITDIKMPDINGLDAAWEIYQKRPVAIVVVSAYSDPEFVRRAEEGHILAYLIKPIRESNIDPAVSVAIRRFEEFQALHQQADDLRQALDDRKTIERAKGILMKHRKLDEPAAFRYLQKLASSRRQKLIDLARAIVSSAEVFEGGDAE